VIWIAPHCTNRGFGTDYSDVGSGGACYYGFAAVWQSNSPTTLAYKDVTVWENGTKIRSARVWTQCWPSGGWCGTGYPGTTWFRTDATGRPMAVNQEFSFNGNGGAHYCFQTTVWFYEGGRWLSSTVTNHVQL
jgi:hypothetical protein